MGDLKRRLASMTREKRLYALQEICNHLLSAHQFDRLERILTDIFFLEAKVEAGMVFDLVVDLNNAITSIPDKRPQQQILDTLVGFEHLVRSRSHVLSLRPDLLIQEMFNFSDSEIIRNKIKPGTQYLQRTGHIWFRLINYSPFVTGRSFQTLVGHVKGVSSIAVTPDDQLIVTGSSDNTLKVWELGTGTCRTTLIGHTQEVTTVTITQDGRYVLSGSEDKTIRVWDLLTGECSKIFRGHKWAITSVKMIPHDRDFISAALGSHWWNNLERPRGEIKIWSLDDKQSRRTVKWHAPSAQTIAVTPDGSQAIVGSLYSYTIRVLDIATGKWIRRLEGHTEWVLSVAITPDGKSVVSGSRDGTAKIWELATGQCRYTLECQHSPRGYRNFVHAVAVTPDGTRVLTGDDAHNLMIWDMQTGKHLQTLKGHTDSISSIAVTHDGRKAISSSKPYDGPGEVKIWNISKEERSGVQTAHDDRIGIIRLAPSISRVVTGSFSNSAWERVVKVWSADTGEFLFRLDNQDLIDTIVMPPNRHMVVTLSGSHTVRVWDMLSGECLQSLRGKTDDFDKVVVMPNGRRVITMGTFIQSPIKIWDIITGECQAILPGHPRIHTVTADGQLGLASGPSAVTADGQPVLANGQDFTIEVWDLNKGKCLGSLAGHRGVAKVLTISPDDRVVITAGGYDDKTLKIWNLHTRECLYTLEGHGAPVVQAKIMPDGRKLITRTGGSDGVVSFWDIGNGTFLQTLGQHRPNDMDNRFESIEISPDGRIGITIDIYSKGTLRIWDLTTGKHLRNLDGHSDRVYSVTVMRDGRHAVSTGWDKTIRIWDIITGVELACFFAEAIIGCYEIDYEGRRIVAGDWNGNWYLLCLENFMNL
jgi:WD40 repeat protein